jgi:NAD(P)-dependent dehydrogenase (short-subunit alcohol dehydrogenase family)
MSKTILITGASSGIGRATALLFAQKGWTVIATMRMPIANVFPINLKIHQIELDVTDEDSMASAVKRVILEFGRIDVLVNNAGYGLTGPIEALTTPLLDKQMRTNVLGLAAMMRLVIPQMRTQGRGSIVNLSSIGGRVSFPFASAYNASKFAVEGLSEAARFELHRYGIHVKLVEPGGVKTNFIKVSGEWAHHDAYEPALTKFKKMAADMDARLPGPEPIARVIYKAATSNSGKLRYPVKSGPFGIVHAVLPDPLWRALFHMILRNLSKPVKNAVAVATK